MANHLAIAPEEGGPTTTPSQQPQSSQQQLQTTTKTTQWATGNWITVVLFVAAVMVAFIAILAMYPQTPPTAPTTTTPHPPLPTTPINHVAGNGGDNGDDGNNNRNNPSIPSTTTTFEQVTPITIATLPHRGYYEDLRHDLYCEAYNTMVYFGGPGKTMQCSAFYLNYLLGDGVGEPLVDGGDGGDGSCAKNKQVNGDKQQPGRGGGDDKPSEQKSLDHNENCGNNDGNGGDEDDFCAKFYKALQSCQRAKTGRINATPAYDVAGSPPNF